MRRACRSCWADERRLVLRPVMRPGGLFGRRLTVVLLAIVAATGLLALPARVPEVRAASPDLTIVTKASYDVQPAQRRVRITLDMVLTNHLKDTVTNRYYFDKAFLSVLPGTSGYQLSWSGKGKPSVGVSKRTAAYTLLQLNLPQRLYSGKTAAYRLRFDLVDNGGTATRDVRIGDSFVSFPVWAFATDSTPGSSVRVVYPLGFATVVQSGDIPAPTTDAAGNVVYETGALSKPLSFFAYLVGDRPGAYAERTVTSTVGGASVTLTVRAWPEDKPWSDRVGGLVGRALPVLSDRIGLPWPRVGGLVVQEAVSRSTGGYAGLFDPSKGLIEVAYFADDFVVLHESAHAWFNGSLLADRWANEAFASYYGLDVARALKVKADADKLTPQLEKARIPLNAWGGIGRETTATEDYAYAATLTLARAIAARAGGAALQAVWADAADRTGAYQPPATTGAISADPGLPGDPETVKGPPDWRGLLDLLEAHTATSFEDLWRTWVVRDTDLPLLQARAAARIRYEAVLGEAGDWQLARPVRDALRAWRFDDATALLAKASAILERRQAIATAATTSGLTVPDTLRTAFGSPDGFAGATLEATAELAAIDRYDIAAVSRLATPDLLQTLGLWNATPDADLAESRTLFATGDLAGSAHAAGTAAAAWTGAEQLGRGRAISLVFLALAVLSAVGLLVGLWRARHRRRHVLLAASAAAAGTRSTAAAAGTEAYGTLATTPDSLQPPTAKDPGSKGAEPD